MSVSGPTTSPPVYVVEVEGGNPTVARPGETLYTVSNELPDGSTYVYNVSSELPPSAIVDIAIVVLSLRMKMGDTKVKVMEASVNAHNELKIGMNNEKIQLAEEQSEAVSKSKKGGVFGEVFGWVAAIATVVVAVATLNPVLLTAGILSVAMLVATETGLMDELVDAIGIEAVMAIMIVIAIITIATPTGPISGLATAAKVTSAAAEIGGGTAKIVTAKFLREAELAGIDIEVLFARMQLSDGTIDRLIEKIIEVMEQNESIFVKTDKLIKDSGQAGIAAASV